MREHHITVLKCNHCANFQYIKNKDYTISFWIKKTNIKVDEVQTFATLLKTRVLTINP